MKAKTYSLTENYENVCESERIVNKKYIWMYKKVFDWKHRPGIANNKPAGTFVPLEGFVGVCKNLKVFIICWIVTDVVIFTLRTEAVSSAKEF
jgi:hypothetical protein